MSVARNAVSFLYDHKFAVNNVCATLAMGILDNAWAISANDHLFIWRVGRLIVVPLLTAGVAGALGHAADVTDAMTVTQNSNSIFYNNKVAIIAGALQLGVSFFNGSWVQNTSYSLGWKIAFSGLVPLLHGARTAAYGHLVDNVLAYKKQHLDEDSALIATNRL